MKIKSYSINGPLKGVCKNHGLWIMQEPNIASPLIYFQKPKWVPADKWEQIVNSIRIELDQELLTKER